MSQAWSRRTYRALLLGLMLGAVVFLHLTILYPYAHLAVLYAVPTLLGAWWFAPRVALMVAVLSLLGHSLDSLLDRTPVITWAAEAAAIALVSVLGISLAEQTRRQSALAQVNALLAEDRRRELERKGLLAESSRLFSSSLHLETVLRTVVDRAASIGDACLLFLLENDGSVLKLHAVGARDAVLQTKIRETLEGTPLPVGEGVVGTVAATGKPTLLSTARTSDLSGPSRFLVDLVGFTSYLAVPLCVRGKVIGVLSLGSVKGGRSFDRVELLLFEELAAMAVGSIENARLFAGQERLVREVSETRQEREQFVGMVTHEMGSALTVLGGYAQLLAQPQDRTPEVTRRATARILSQVQRLARLVDDLRDVSRIERGAFTIQKGPCDLVELVREVVMESQATTSLHEVRLAVGCGHLCGNWDRGRLAQVLNNLVANAIKYSPAGGSIVVAVDPADDGARVSVSDEGIGIAADDLPLLFRPYARLKQASDVKGTGLGLFIAKAIVEAHGGQIVVESTLGKGSVFTVTLPGACGCLGTTIVGLGTVGYMDSNAHQRPATL